MSEFRKCPSDPVLDFIYNPAVSALVSQGSDSWPYSRLSGTRKEKIAYKLIVLRCAEMGIEPPSREEARSWR